MWGAGSARGRKLRDDQLAEPMIVSKAGFGKLPKHATDWGKLMHGISLTPEAQAAKDAAAHRASFSRDQLLPVPVHRIPTRSAPGTSKVREINSAPDWRKGKDQRRGQLRRYAGAAGGGLTVGAGAAHLLGRDHKATPVGKRDRAYDSQDAHQRQLGGLAAAATLGGAVLAGHGVAGAVRSTKVLRKVKWAKELKPNGLGEDAILVHPKSLAQLAGGGGLVAVGDATRKHAQSRSNRRWS